MNEKILITGGCGFVGSNIALLLKRDFPDVEIVALDNLKRRGSELNIPRLQEHGIQFVHGDIRNKEDLDSIGEISVLIEAAAEPSVLSGIDSTPDYVLNANLVGAVNCLNFAVRNKARFVFLSTSRVYPVAALNRLKYIENETRFVLADCQEIEGVSGRGIAENFPLHGARSFYGTTKLAAELLIQEYVEFYDLKAVINRCGVLTGPWQMGKVDQGVVVLWLAKHFWKQELSYIGFGGDGKQVRDIMHIDDLYGLVKLQLQFPDKFNGEVFNVGGGEEVSVSLNELTRFCQELTGNTIMIHKETQTRAADMPIYITDNTKVEGFCGWHPKWKTAAILQDIFTWMRNNENKIKNILK